jgi:hypothetical protein
MSAKLSAIFYILLCLEIGIALTFLPWIPQGFLGLPLSDWGNNYFLLYAARQTGYHGLQTVIASGWVRGAVSGVGVLNLGIAFWETFHFKQTVNSLQGQARSPETSKHNAARPAQTNNVSDNERRDDGSNHTAN